MSIFNAIHWSLYPFKWYHRLILGYAVARFLVTGANGKPIHIKHQEGAPEEI